MSNARLPPARTTAVRLAAWFLMAALIAPAAWLAAAELDRAALAKIPATMQQFVEAGQVAGAVTVVGRADGVLACDAVGWRDIEARQPMTKDTLFRIASMTKPVTAIGVMLLVEEGKLSVEDPVEKHLPEFRGQMLVAARTKDSLALKRAPRPITVRDLLTHTSGLGKYPPGLADIYFRRNYTLAEGVMAASQQPLEFEPGSKWAYCNSGIDTLGRIIEVVSGKPYEAFLQERIFGPLGMSDTTFYPNESQWRRVASLHEVKQGKLCVTPGKLLGPPQGARFPIPAGGLYSTGADLATLYQMMLHRGRHAGRQILSEQSVQAMTSVQTGELTAGFVNGMGYGFGWGVVRQPVGVTEMLSPGTFGHGGAYGTQGWIDPKQDLFVVLLIQRVGMPNGDASDFRRQLQALAVAAIKGAK